MEVGKLLMHQKKFASTAESCTGGNIAHLITSVPGSSAYFKGSVVAYANEVKIEQLGVAHEDIKTSGAVSLPVVEQMARGACRYLHADYAISTSGIAGPDGGTDEKPVGTVWIAVAGPESTFSQKFTFGKNRERNILLASAYGLNLLRKMLLGQL